MRQSAPVAGTVASEYVDINPGPRNLVPEYTDQGLRPGRTGDRIADYD
jgi:hypothetical protein